MATSSAARRPFSKRELSKRKVKRTPVSKPCFLYTQNTYVFALGLCNSIFAHGETGENKSESTAIMFGQNWTTILCSDWLLKK